MFENPFHRAIYLTGPTACGKSAVGVALARRLNAEILALDSMTLYRGMDIGTAKPTMAERGDIPHHLIDVLDPWEAASVAQYRSWALEKILEIESRGRRPLFVGGTALYLKTLLRGLFEGPGADPEIRHELEREAQELGSAALHVRLETLDPAIAARLHPNDERRIVRALEVIRLTGRPLSAFQTEHDRPAPPGVQVYALERPRAELYDRINRRVVAMFEAGLIEEVRGLMTALRPLSSVTAQAVGYREAIELLKGRLTTEAAINLIQTGTRQFAKRQGTWFRGLAEVQMVPVETDDSDSMARQLAERIESRNHSMDGKTALHGSRGF